MGDKYLFLFLFSFFFGTFSQAAFSMGKTYTYYGFLTEVRNYIDIWENNPNYNNIRCTLLSVLLLPASVVSIIVAIKNKKRVELIVFSAILNVFSIYFMAKLGNRGYFVSLLFALLGIGGLYIYKYYNKSLKKPLIIFALVFLFLLLIYFLISINILGILDALVKIPVLYRFFVGGSNGSRISLYKEFFQVFWKYPFGGMNQKKVLQSGLYVHNLWLDVYTIGGIIPFVSFMFLTYLTLKEIFTSKENKWENILFSSFAFSMMGISLFEPTINANGYFYSMFFALFSYITWQKKKKNISKSESIDEHLVVYEIKI